MAEFRLITLVLLLTACVSKKEYQLLLNKNNELNQHIKTALNDSEKAQDSYQKLRDNLITQNSLNNVLLADKIKLQNDIKALEQNLGNISNEAQKRQTALNKELAEQNQNLSQKQAKLTLISDAFGHVIDEQEKLLLEVTKLVEDVDDFEMEVQYVNRIISLILYDKFTFQSGYILTNYAGKKMEKLANILHKAGAFSLHIVGHTGPDANDKKYPDLLDLSLAKAAMLAKHTQKTGHAINVLPSGKGAHSPRVSNETQAGRELNNRVEIHIIPDWNPVLKLIE